MTRRAPKRILPGARCLRSSLCVEGSGDLKIEKFADPKVVICVQKMSQKNQKIEKLRYLNNECIPKEDFSSMKCF